MKSCLPIALFAALAPAAYGQGDSALPPPDLSIWGMFVGADWLVKAVIIGLLIASIVTWTVLVAKTLELSRAFSSLRRAAARLEGARALTDVADARSDPLAAAMIDAANKEIALSADALADRDGLKERVGNRLQRIERAASQSMTQGAGILATIGATAPFVGLFGTVWGIMNSFIGIAEARTTNLAVIAPGIAEALLATGLGLVAAIPAVVIYNHFSRRIGAYRTLAGDVSTSIINLVSRDLSRGVARPGA